MKKMNLKIFSIILLFFLFLLVFYFNNTNAQESNANLNELSTNISEIISNSTTECIKKENDKKSIEKTEKIVQLKLEELYIKEDNVIYRDGPGKKYSKKGTLNKDTKIERIGISNNKWSKVIIKGNYYFIKSTLLTSEKPKKEEINDNTSGKISSGKKGDLQKYTQSILNNYDWEESEIEPLIKLWNRESGWNPNSHNRNSGAHGIPQALPGSKMSSEGSDWETNGETQIRWGLKYIKGRYGSPSNAWNFFCNKGWY